MCCVTFFQQQEIESAKLKKKFEGGPLFDESHASTIASMKGLIVLG